MTVNTIFDRVQVDHGYEQTHTQTHTQAHTQEHTQAHTQEVSISFNSGTESCGVYNEVPRHNAIKLD